MNNILIAPILLPLITGILNLLLPKRAKFLHALLSIVVAAISLGIAAYILTLKDPQLTFSWLILSPDLRIGFDLFADHFGRIALVIGFTFTLLVTIYSLRFMNDHPRQRQYYAYLMMTSAAASGVLLANNLILILFFWELVGVLLYALVSIGGMDAMPAANKTLIIIGLADLSLLLGIALLWFHSGTLSVSDLMANPQTLSGWVPTAAFILMMIGALAKAGAIPLHSWIPAISTVTPAPIMAYLPAALDKLLGIYLLARISISLFVMTPATGILLMAIGAITIVGAVLMALIQHDYRKMLSFHAVSQVGYMVLGIGTGIPIGIIGGLFHMLNHMIYKCCLFLCSGSVQHQTKKTKFSELGGLAGAMPWTFTACLIAALAISGVPPLNGFVSKWLIYQGIIDRGGALFPLFLLTAMFGSALTLASFMKLLYSLFWGDRPKDLDQVKEAGWAMRIPVALLAIACLFFGIFYLVPVNQIIRPILGEMGIQAVIPGIWQSTLATVLLIISLIIGFLFYLGGRARQAVETEVFLGGEALDPAVYRVPGTQFYGPIKGLGGLKQLLSRGERGDFDLSTRGVNVITWAANAIFKFVDQALSDLFRELVPALIRILGQILQTLNRKQVLTYVLWIAYAGSAVAILRFPEQASAILTARIIACVGIFGWAILALIENDLRRFLIFAATSQLGFVLLGGTASWRPALIHFVSAGLAILVLFFCCRSIYRKRNTYNMQEMDGLAEQMPGRFIVFLLAALWLSGLPPFGSFFSKYLLGISFSGENLIFPMILAAAALLTLGYSLRPLRHFLRVGE